MKLYFGDVDAMVVEISSLRIICGDEVCIQISRLREKLSYLPDGPALSAELFKNPQNSGLLVTEYLKTHQIDESLSRILRTLEFREQDADEMYQDTLDILNVLQKPTLIVCHFIRSANTAPIAQRVLLKDALQKAVGAHASARLYDPTDDVVNFPTRAIKDLSHYTEEFETHLATIYSQEIAKLLNH